MTTKQQDKPADQIATTRKTTKKRKLEYGPFARYQFVTTPTGEFAVPKGQVLSFGAVTVLDKATSQMVKKLVPEYRDANEKEIEKAQKEYDDLMAALKEDETEGKDEGE